MSLCLAARAATRLPRQQEVAWSASETARWSVPCCLGRGPPRAASSGDGPLAKGDKEQKRPSLSAQSDIEWGELLSSEPANVAAVVLTGALAWAGSSLLQQLPLSSCILLLTSGMFFGCLIELPFAVLCVLGRGIN
ncbi:hypothetical protein PVAP13_8NG123802 [Panicum virgatum]|uniref:Uncharacterized protein n=1 Tax=Panicum virgatum TaxID=38727 RepID=A0A8T0P849_PANVG|nr:hypothetical protein PVAP13_8NG123802 [Panicum virgatum]